MNSETNVIERTDETVGEPTSSRPTKRDLVERGLDAIDTSKMQAAQISTAAGGIAFSNLVEVMDFAKGMATSGVLIPKYLRGSPGACLGITLQAIGWRMDPFQVAQKSYAVNDRVGYESQLIHGVIEARAPLQHRLDCRYEGEIVYEEIEKTDEETGETFTLEVINRRKSTRSCIIVGLFINGDVREYQSPMLKNIKVQNSPLWKDDPDQQLFYYASRAWARKWCPDVLMGIYAREELETDRSLGREAPDDEAPGLHARLAGSERSVEGHQDGHAARELDQIAGTGQVIEHAPTGPDSVAEASPDVAKEPGATDTHPAPNERTTGRPRGRPKGTKVGKPSKEADLPERTVTLTSKEKLPSKAEVKRIADKAEKSAVAKLSEEIDAEIRAVKTAKQYLSYARKWIAACPDSTELFVRWTAERKLRNALGVTADEREPLDKLVAERRENLESDDEKS